MDRVQALAAAIDDLLVLALGLLVITEIHVGLGCIGKCGGLGETAVFSVGRFPVKNGSGELEVLHDGCPGLCIGLGTGLLGRSCISLTGHQHRNAAEVGGEVVIAICAESAGLGLVNLLRCRRDDVVADGVLKVIEEDIGTRNHLVRRLPEVLEEARLGFDAPGMVGHFDVPSF